MMLKKKLRTNVPYADDVSHMGNQVRTTAKHKHKTCRSLEKINILKLKDINDICEMEGWELC